MGGRVVVVLVLVVVEAVAEGLVVDVRDLGSEIVDFVLVFVQV